jgi:hypothetical protein
VLMIFGIVDCGKQPEGACVVDFGVGHSCSDDSKGACYQMWGDSASWYEQSCSDLGFKDA